MLISFLVDREYRKRVCSNTCGLGVYWILDTNNEFVPHLKICRSSTTEKKELHPLYQNIIYSNVLNTRPKKHLLTHGLQLNTSWPFKYIVAYFAFIIPPTSIKERTFSSLSLGLYRKLHESIVSFKDNALYSFFTTTEKILNGLK